MRVKALTAVVAAIVVVVGVSVGAAPASPRSGRRDFAGRHDTSHLSSELRQAIGLQQAEPGFDAYSLPHDNVGRFDVLLNGADSDALVAAVQAVGGEVSSVIPNQVNALVDGSQLQALGQQPGVGIVRDANEIKPSAVVSEGVATTGANVWQAPGVDRQGAGVKVAIVDVGFKNWDQESSDDLPASVVTAVDYCSGTSGVVGPSFTTQHHGTEVASIVHDMAPLASLTLICIQNSNDFQLAANYIEANGIRIVNGSFGNTVSGRGDGTGFFGTIVNDLRNNGVLYVASAGNEALGHVPFFPSGSNASIDTPHPEIPHAELVPFSAGNYELSFVVPANTRFDISMKWDAWPTTNQDFDFYVFDGSINSPTSTLYMAGFDDQASTPSEPVEFGAHNPDPSVPLTHPYAVTYYLYVDRFSATINPRFDIYIDGASPGSVELQNAFGSMADPADSPAAFSVGAICYANSVREPFSSLGPTIDGRLKPDIYGPDGTSAQTTVSPGYGPANGNCTSGFTGTSASAPHVAGAAALVSGAYPDLNANQVRQFLEVRAGLPKTSPLTGSGNLTLGPVSTTTTPANFAAINPPVRLMDTRPGLAPAFHDSPLTAGEKVALPVRGAGVPGGVPVDATAVVLNVTVTEPSASGFLTVWPNGLPAPNASNVNFGPGQTVPNLVTVGIGTNDSVAIRNAIGSAHVVVDLMGYYSPSAAVGANFLPSPVRALDTRPGLAPSTRDGVFGPNQQYDLQLRGAAAGFGVPDNATAVILNVTVTEAQSSGFVTLYPGGTFPGTSNVNYVAGQTVPNLVVVGLGSSGTVRIRNSLGTTHIIVDVFGYFAPGGAQFVSMAPSRDLDTRPALGGTGALVANSPRNLKAVPAFEIPATAVGVSMNATVTEAAGSGFLAVYPDSFSGTSNLNYVGGQTVANAVISKKGSGGNVRLLAAVSGTHVVIELNGYYVP